MSLDTVVVLTPTMNPGDIESTTKRVPHWADGRLYPSLPLVFRLVANLYRTHRDREDIHFIEALFVP